MRSSLSLVLLSALIGPEFPISIPVQLASAEIKYFSSSIPASSKYVQFVTVSTTRWDMDIEYALCMIDAAQPPGNA